MDGVVSPLVITGRIVRDARHQVRSADGCASICFELQPPPGPRGKPRTYRVVKSYGSGAAAHYASSTLARQLRRGVLVIVHAAAEDAGRVSTLHGVDHIETPDLPRARNVTGESD